MSDKLSDTVRNDIDLGGAWLTFNGNDIYLADGIAALEQRMEELEKALYEAIEVGGAPESMWVDTDEETKRAWPIPDIDLEEALEALAAAD